MQADPYTAEMVETDCSDHADWRELRILFPAQHLAVRDALHSIMGGLGDMGLREADAIQVELALAEAMNNVCEHAYAGDNLGTAELRVRQRRDRLDCMLVDSGHPIPAGDLPGKGLPPMGTDVRNLPEGGFGWYIIRTLTSGLGYTRDGPRNVLRFSLDLDQKMRPV